MIYTNEEKVCFDANKTNPKVELLTTEILQGNIEDNQTEKSEISFDEMTLGYFCGDKNISDLLTQVLAQDIKPAHQDVDLISLCPDSPIAKMAANFAETAEFPRNTAFWTMLSIYSSVACRAYSLTRGRNKAQPTSIYFCGQQPPGTGKSWCMETAQEPVLHHRRKKAKSLRLAKAYAKNALATAVNKKDKAKLESRIRVADVELDALFQFIGNSTPEALDSILASTGGYFSVASTEQGAIDSLLGLAYGDKANNKDALLSGYMGEICPTERVSRGAYKDIIVGCMTVLAQAPSIIKIIQSSSLTGLPDRFVFWAEPHMLGRRQFNDDAELDEVIEQIYFDSLSKVYHKTLDRAEFLDLPKLILSAEAKASIRQTVKSYEPSVANDGKNSSDILRGAITKLSRLIARVAAVLHVSIEPDNLTINDKRVDEAIAIAEAYIKHLQNLVGSEDVSSSSEHERVVLDYFHKRAKHKSMSGRLLTDGLRRRAAFNVNGAMNINFVRLTILRMVNKGVLHVDSHVENDFNKSMFSCI